MYNLTRNALQMEAELLRTVPEWEAEHGMEFLIDDIRLVEVIMAVQQSMDEEKNAKKVCDNFVSAYSTYIRTS